MNLGDLTGLVEKPFAAVSNLVNTPNSAGRYRPFYLRNLLDAVQGRTLYDAVDGTITLITGGSSGIGEAAAKKIVSLVGQQIAHPLWSRPFRIIVVGAAHDLTWFGLANRTYKLGPAISA